MIAVGHQDILPQENLSFEDKPLCTIEMTKISDLNVILYFKIRTIGPPRSISANGVKPYVPADDHTISQCNMGGIVNTSRRMNINSPTRLKRFTSEA
jgi:hypothetical protein